MQCQHCQQSLDDYLDSLLAPASASLIENHLAECADCKQHFDEGRKLQAALRKLPAPALQAGFIDQAIAHADHRYRKTRRLKHMAAGGALAAGLVTAAIIGPLLNVPGVNPAIPEPQQFTLAPHQSGQLQLTFSSDREENVAEFTIKIPDHVSIDGFSGKQEIRWQTSLKAGTNELRLPLTAHREGTGELITRIKTETETREFRFRLIPGSPPATGQARDPLLA